MTDHPGAQLAALLCVVAPVLLLAQAWRRPPRVLGLALAYWVGLWMIHGLGGLIHVLGLQRTQDTPAALTGFAVTGTGLAAFLAANLLTVAVFGHAALPPVAPPSPQAPRLAAAVIVLGLGLHFAAGRLLPRIPGTDAVLSSGFRLGLAGFALLWLAYRRGGRAGRAWGVLALAGVVPLLSVGLDGFLGFGVFFVATLACFVAVFYQPRWHLLVLGPVLAFLALSLYPTYLAVRNQIRGAVWAGASPSERLEKMMLMATEFEAFDLDNQKHVDAVDLRANQNILVGLAWEHLEVGNADFARGQTLVAALVAVIPRALWPNKPTYAGSAGLVTQYTGVPFEAGTSVGIGHVMELYVNFGLPGVAIGLALVGALLGWLDVRGLHALRAGRLTAFLACYLVGLAFLQVGGNFAEASSSAAGSLVLLWGVTRLLGPLPLPAPLPYHPPARPAPPVRPTLPPDRAAPAAGAP